MPEGGDGGVYRTCSDRVGLTGPRPPRADCPPLASDVSAKRVDSRLTLPRSASEGCATPSRSRSGRRAPEAAPDGFFALVASGAADLVSESMVRRLKRRCGPPKGQEAEGDGEPACRVCMDTVTDAELADGRAMRLGCRCSDGLDTLHTTCAERWFRIRGSAICEVCGSVAANLPADMKREFAALKVREDAEGGPHGAPRRDGQTYAVPLGRTTILLPASSFLRPSVMGGVRSYLILASAFTVLMYFFYSAFLGVNHALAVMFALFVAFSASLPRLTVCTRRYFPPVIVLIVSWILVVIMGFTIVLAKLNGWEPVRSSVVGGLCGGLLSLATCGVAELVWRCYGREARGGDRGRV